MAASAGPPSAAGWVVLLLGERPGYRGRAAGDLQPGVDVFQVLAHRALRYPQPAGELGQAAAAKSGPGPRKKISRSVRPGPAGRHPR
jgi:hypothetical protein